MKISKRAAAVTGSLTLQIDATAKEMRAKGIDVIGFGAGEPDFDTPAHIVAAAKAALDAGKTRYTATSGTPELKAAICKKFSEHNGLDFGPENIVVSNGGKHSLYNAFCAILDDGDEVLLPSPFWISYPEMIRMAGGVPIFVKGTEENEFLPTIQQLEQYVTNKTKAIVLNSPCNPSGMVISYETLCKLADFAKAHDLIIISDEVYEDFVYEEQRIPSIATIDADTKSRTIIINSVSKTYAMTGWRIGYLACDAALAKVITNWQSHSTSNPNSIAQAAVVAALEGPNDCIYEMVAAFRQRRDLMVSLLNEIPGIQCTAPRGAFYCLPSIKDVLGKRLHGETIADDKMFAHLLLKEKAVAVVPGSGFGADGYIRLSYALGEQSLSEGLMRIKEFVESLED